MVTDSILVVDDRYTPLFPSTTVRSCEEAFEILEDTPVKELWLRHDMFDAVGLDSLIGLLIIEEDWEGRSQIDCIVLFSADGIGGDEIVERLEDAYPTRKVAITPEMFEDTLPQMA